MKQMENEMNVNVPLEVIKASEIEPKEVKWLWYPYIPYGKVTLLQGDPGDGKSKLMLSIAALLSKGEPLPFTETEENEPIRCTVHLWTAFGSDLAARTTTSFCRLHRASDNRRLRAYASRSISVDASGRYSLISSIEISVLQDSGLL